MILKINLTPFYGTIYEPFFLHNSIRVKLLMMGNFHFWNMLNICLSTVRILTIFSGHVAAYEIVFGLYFTLYSGLNFIWQFLFSFFTRGWMTNPNIVLYVFSVWQWTNQMHCYIFNTLWYELPSFHISCWPKQKASFWQVWTVLNKMTMFKLYICQLLPLWWELFHM